MNITENTVLSFGKGLKSVQLCDMLENELSELPIVDGKIKLHLGGFEILTLKQLGRHAKPIAIYNVNGYYDAMLAMLNKSVKENFMREVTLDLYKVFDDDDAMIHYLENSDEELVDVVKMKIF